MIVVQTSQGNGCASFSTASCVCRHNSRVGTSTSAKVEDQRAAESPTCNTQTPCCEKQVSVETGPGELTLRQLRRRDRGFAAKAARIQRNSVHRPLPQQLLSEQRAVTTADMPNMSSLTPDALLPRQPLPERWAGMLQQPLSERRAEMPRQPLSERRAETTADFDGSADLIPSLVSMLPIGTSRCRALDQMPPATSRLTTGASMKSHLLPCPLMILDT